MNNLGPFREEENPLTGLMERGEKAGLWGGPRSRQLLWTPSADTPLMQKNPSAAALIAAPGQPSRPERCCG